MTFVVFLLFLVLNTEASTSVNNKTWESALISSIIPNIPSLQRCQDICKERQDCKGITWISDQTASFFPGSCALFCSVPGPPNVPCTDCVSSTLEQQDECTTACWGMGFEMVSSQVLLKTQDCQNICERTPRCHQYTSYEDKTTNKQLCTLFTNATASQFSQGLVVTGGNRREGKVETFPPYIGCEDIPDLPGVNGIGNAVRSGHSAVFLPGPPASLVVCGGHHVGGSIANVPGGWPDDRDPNMFQDCVFWRKGLDVWETFISPANLNMDLGTKSEAWAPPRENRILLITQNATKWAPSGEPGFPLKHPAKGSCLINEGETFVLFGSHLRDGYVPDEEMKNCTCGNVDRYSIDGHLESLPSLGFYIREFGCGYYTDGEGRKVLMISHEDIKKRGPKIDGTTKSNVMLLFPGADAWVYGPNIIGPGYGMAKSLLSLPNGEMLLAGFGWDGDKVARFSNGTWKEVGSLQTERRDKASVLADLQQLCG